MALHVQGIGRAVLGLVFSEPLQGRLSLRRRYASTKSGAIPISPPRAASCHVWRHRLSKATVAAKRNSRTWQRDGWTCRLPIQRAIAPNRLETPSVMSDSAGGRGQSG